MDGTTRAVLGPDEGEAARATKEGGGAATGGSSAETRDREEEGAEVGLSLGTQTDTCDAGGGALEDVGGMSAATSPDTRARGGETVCAGTDDSVAGTGADFVAAAARELARGAREAFSAGGDVALRKAARALRRQRLFVALELDARAVRALCGALPPVRWQEGLRGLELWTKSGRSGKLRRAGFVELEQWHGSEKDFPELGEVVASPTGGVVLAALAEGNTILEHAAASLLSAVDVGDA